MVNDMIRFHIAVPRTKTTQSPSKKASKEHLCLLPSLDESTYNETDPLVDSPKMEEGSRWTCEACGCNTNASADTNCGICGTSQSGPSILRRAGYSAARAAWLARPRGANSNRLDDLEDEHDLWESVVHGISDELILDGADRGRFVESTRQRFLDAARAFAHRNGAEAAPSVDPDVIWEAATTNSYSPYWMSSTGSEIQVGEGNERRHLAHVPAGSGEGQAIRAEHPLPRNSTVGFRVAFEHPTAEVAGANMGGCYLVGLTTSSFSAWSESKGLQNSPFFFGIEDGGLVYEGSSRSRREAEVSSQNSHGVLFGSRDVVTCITDGRTLTFWRDNTLLGTVVNSLPRSLPLFPVVVPFNSEVTVAITNVQSDPLPILRTFAVDWKKVQQEKEEDLRTKLATQRSVLIQEDGCISARLREVLQTIFDMHQPHYDRLWYRCGWKLEKLEEIVQSQGELMFKDFCAVIEKVVAEDLQKEESLKEKTNECQVGDKAELVNGYEKFGDAKGGPLQVGDRGIVVDIQRGQNGEQRSIRVLHNSRRWYYQPQAIRSERSGLIECTSVWFLRDILRSHGFDHTTLESLVGKPVTESSWRVGDIVVPNDSSELMGRIVAASKERDAVKVQYANPAFLEAVGLPASDPLEVCRVESCRLKHSTVMKAVVEDASVQGGDQDQKNVASGNEKTRSDIASLSRLERIDIDSLVKECRRSSDSLASLFAGGLPDAFLSALTVAERLMNSLEPPDDLAERISSVGDLAVAIADQLFGDPLTAQKMDQEDPGSVDSTQSETSDLASTRQRARLSHRNRRLRLIRESSRHGEGELQDRRSMILSLVSRGGRRTGNRFPNEDRTVPHLLGSPGDLFGESWDMAAALSSGNNNSRARGASDLQATTPKAPNEDSKPSSFLDSILRCRCDLSQIGVKQGGTADHHAFVRQLVQNGIVADNVEWMKALIEAQSEKTNRRIPAILRSVADEEGTPLLFLAVLQRCSPELISRLLDWGAPSRPEEVRKAAETNQPASLSLLLQRSPLQELELEIDSFSEPVKEVFEKSKVRQLELELAMTEAAGKFMVDILHKLFELALCSRRLCSSKMESCGRVVCEVLVGNVLLTSVQKSQKEAEEHKDEPDCPGDAYLGGLLGVLPCSVLADCLFSDKCHITTFLLVCEEYLCGKDMADIASGLTILFVMLRSFSHLSVSPLVARFGLDKFVSEHHTLASERITKIKSKRGNADPSKQNNVLCPKGHAAVLHITRHSSFRCDLCGNGVDRGCPMHGCRQCDWDACEKCTDAAETGLVKCKTLKDLSSLCQGYLSTMKEPAFTAEDSARFSQTLNYLATESSTSELKQIIGRLQHRSVSALSDLAALLLEPGSVTIHEFVSVVLPALHRTFVPQRVPACGGRQTKKAKVSDMEGIPSEGRQDLLEFIQESLLQLTADHGMDTSSALDKQEANENGMQSETNENETSGSKGPDTDSTTSLEQQHSSKVDISYCAGASELLRRLHQVLSFREGVLETLGSSPKCNELQALKAPIELQISPSTFDNTTVSSMTSSVVHAEPLVPIIDISRHILRTYRITDSEYITFCRRLANEKAMIVDRSDAESEVWRIARVLSFDERSGANIVQYATSWKRGCERETLNLDSELNASQMFRFSGPTSSLVLAARQYFVFCRTPTAGSAEVQPNKTTEDTIQEQTSPFSQVIGTRVESNCENPNEWVMYTVVAVDTSSNSTDGSTCSFVLVSDDGRVLSGISTDRIRTQSLSNISQEESARARRSGRIGREDRHGLFPFFARQRGETSAESVASSTIQSRALKRSWSALGLVDEMHPVDLQVVQEDVLQAPDGIARSASLSCSLGDTSFLMIAEVSRLEAQPEISISFSSHEKLPGLEVSDTKEATLIWVLREISSKQEKAIDLPPESPFSLFFSLKMSPDQCRLSFPPEFASVKVPARKPPVDEEWMGRPDSKSRKLSPRSLSQEEPETESLVCDGFDSTCVECMEVLTVLSECAENPPSSTSRDGPKLPGLANSTLSKKLSDELDDPVRVIGGALPHWCLKGPSFAPCVFAYETRRALLERAAFGVSRSTLKQQEAKVNVHRLRQRMASLRSKAVELVGEAFSGGAEDPTALQLQADELYGMEEALAMKVRAAFRAQNWQEHSLQVAKVAVRREYLILDAAAAMEKYSYDSTIRMRRLEVRFVGESGFDAASGDEAGVTRGFYADCAEALLSADNVASVFCSSSCLSVATITDVSSGKVQPMALEEHDKESPKLPLWVPDMDNSNQVIIPTPRVNKRSGPGVFPRPLPNYHPQHSDVLSKFRLTGRLFAAAMRDGFMFPLPLSSSFLNLVQNCCTSESRGYVVLSSDDLPRPGFLGGEVYGAESTVCKALDELDASEPPLSRVQLLRRCEEIATEKDFARKALGKTYDCSFNEYFQDRTFVDPFDPGQGADAVPLCTKGSSKPVTIYNIREWVALAKRFILHEGVVEQAKAFRSGIEDFFLPEYLSLFTPQELQDDVCGVGDQVDNWDDAAIRKLFKLDGGKGAAEALVAVAAIGGEGGAALSRRFGPSSPTIGFLVNALRRGTPTQRRQFLSFVTSVPIVTPGNIEVVPILSPSGEFLPMSDPCCLPRANTCTRRLYLPKFDDFESFEKVLWAVVGAENRFKGFWEWGG